MKTRVETIAAAVIGAIVVLAAVWLTGPSLWVGAGWALYPPGNSASSLAQHPAPASEFAPGTVLLAKGSASCLKGWTTNGAVALNTSADYTLGTGQERSNPGIFTSATDGFENVIFALCVKG